MKGIAVNILTAFMIVILLLVLSSVNSIFAGDFRVSTGEVKESDIVIKTETYAMDSAMDAAETYLRTGLRFSSYQAMHDMGKNGGWVVIPEDRNEGGIAVWYRTAEDRSPDEVSVEDNLPVLILNNLNQYSSQDYTFLEDFTVKTPIYGDADVLITGIGLEVETFSDGILYIERKSGNDIIRLEKDPQMEEKIGVDFFGLLEKAKQEGAERAASLQSYIESSAEDLPKSLNGDSCESEFLKKTGKNMALVEQSLEDGIKEGFESETASGNYIMSVGVLMNDITISQSPDLGTCVYQYSFDVALKMTVSDTSTSIPVVDGEQTVLANPSFVFTVQHKAVLG